MSDAARLIRSPSYPSMALRDAADSVAKIEGPYRSTPVDRLNAAKLIGYSALSGPANQALAALAGYGLLERVGKGEVRVTERARDILHPSSEEDRKAKLWAAALEPPLYRELRERFAGIAVPPEDGVVTYLNRQGFNPNAVRRAAKAFLQTMRYLEELGVSDSNSVAPPAAENEAESGAADNPPAKTVKVGDYVQWTSGGADQFRVARKVVGIFPDGNHAQVFGSNTGIPMSELRVVDPPEAAATPPVVIAVPASSEAVVQGENDFTVLQRGNRLQITADVDLEGIATLKEMLTDYESILRRLAGKKTQQQEPAAKDFSVTVYAPDGVREVRTEFFADLPELLEFIEQHKARAPHSLLHARLPARVSPNQRHAVSLAGAEVI